MHTKEGLKSINCQYSNFFVRKMGGFSLKKKGVSLNLFGGMVKMP